MTKEAKATIYAVEPMVKLLRSEAISDGGTEKIAAAIEGTWVRVNETMFILMEEGKVTLVYSDDTEVGCACEKFSDPSMKVMCEHIIAFENLPEKPQMEIYTPECRNLREYLFSRGWYVDDRYLYPLPDEQAMVHYECTECGESTDTESGRLPGWIAEHAAVCPGVKPEELDPMNEDKPLDIGVDDDPKPIGKDMTMVHYQCPKCGEEIDIEDGKLRDWKLNHMDVCKGKTKTNPSEIPNSSKLPQKPVVKESLTPEKPTVAKSAPVEKPQKEEEKKVKPPSKKFTCEMCGTEYDSADDALNCIEKCKEARDIESTKALIVQDTAEGEDWSNSQIEVMRKTVAEKATPEEFAYFLNVAKYTGLNPFLKEIYFVKNDKGQTTIITGRDGYLTIAKRDPRFRGIHSMEVCEKDEFEMSFIEGKMTVSKHLITDFMDRGEIIGAWACGRMDGQDPVTIFASMKEYDKSKNALGGKIWKQYTSSMIRKVAESMVLKRIAGISGLVTEAEIGGTDLITLDGEDD